MTQAAPGLYTDPAIYDILHARGTAAEVDGLERMAARVNTRRARQTWLEPACGTARYLRLAARRGRRTIGFDINPAMIDYGRRLLERGPADVRRRSRLFVGDMTGFADQVGPEQVDFAFNPINTIRHLQSDAQMLAHLRQIAAVLSPGGIYAVGLTLTSYGMEFPSEDVWRGSRGRGRCRVTQVVQYVPPTRDGDRDEQVHSHLVIARGRRTEHRDSSYTLRCYSQRQWLGLIARSPLTLEAMVNDDGEEIDASPSGYGIYLLRKP